MEIDKTIIPFSDMVMVMANSARHSQRVSWKIEESNSQSHCYVRQSSKDTTEKNKADFAWEKTFKHGLDVGLTNIVDDNHLSNLDGSPYRNDRLRWPNASKTTCTNDAHAPFFVPLPEKRGEIFAHALIGPAWRTCPMLSSMKNKGIPPRRRKQTYGIRKAPK